MKKKIFLSLIGLFLGLTLSTHAFSLTLYDDFSGTSINKSKWMEGEFIREIKDGKLLSKTETPSPIVMTSFPYQLVNNLDFTDPNSINLIQTEVTILESSLIGTGANTRTFSGIVGRFFNTGIPGGG